ncbi:MAG TPA: hypothetical protein VGN18_10525 [Jatrophihabitans sp.]|jgi:hypothetical protein|uniref:hypothetical protein n=1 Tax=Jatrophihabitans sp. TaxID=1932789 RepID=UPI002DF979CB|nr:hypothetical protein [Jatrophihabitans sp.]
MTEPNPHPGGWRAGVRARAAGLAPPPRTPVAEFDAKQSAVDDATRPRRSRTRPVARLAEWFDASEARRYEDALIALLDLRRAVLVAGAEGGDFTVAGAHVPELTEEVKRLVSKDEPAFDAYLRLLHRIGTAEPPAPVDRVVDLGSPS